VAFVSSLTLCAICAISAAGALGSFRQATYFFGDAWHVFLALGDPVLESDCPALATFALPRWVDAVRLEEADLVRIKPSRTVIGNATMSTPATTRFRSTIALDP
jgi:hypothetical protein